MSRLSAHLTVTCKSIVYIENQERLNHEETGSLLSLQILTLGRYAVDRGQDRSLGKCAPQIV